jgi:hypothetical protein
MQSILSATARRARLFGLLVTMLVAGPAFAADAPAITAFVNVNVVPMDRERVLRGQSVIVESGRISAIGRNLKIPAGARTIDGKGRFLSPGLADMHNHSDTREDLALLLANGVTTMLNLGEARNSFVGRTRLAVDRGEVPSPRILVALAVDGSPQYGHLVLAKPEDAPAAVRLAKVNGYAFIKVYNNLSPEVFAAVVAAAKTEGLAVVGHGVSSVGLEKQLEAGQVMVAHAEEFFYTFFAPPGAPPSDTAPDPKRIPEVIGLLKRAGAFVVADLHNYATIAGQFGRPDVVAGYLAMPEARFLSPADRLGWISSSYQKKKVNLSDRVEFLRNFIKAMADAGLPLMSGGDAPSIPGLVPGFSVHRNLAMLEDAGLSRFQILSLATRVPGEFVNRYAPAEAPVGIVSVGSRADLVLTDGNPLDGLATLKRPAGVMANGRWYDAGALQGLLDGIATKYAGLTVQPR